MRLATIVATLCCMLGSLQSTRGQITANEAYSDPDEMRLTDPLALVKAGRKAFTAAERSALCHRGRGFIALACRVGSSGRIQAIIGATLYQAAQPLSPALLNRWKESVRQHVIFHVPAVDKGPNRSRYRYASVVVPLRAFCQ